MRIFTYLFFLFILGIACNKKAMDAERLSVKQEKIFTSKQEAFEAISGFLSKEAPTENLKAIDNISYIHTPTKSFALVFYETNSGKHNLVYTQSMLSYEDPGSGTITVCEGDECACRVRAIIDNQGNVTVGCSCSTCEMVTTEL